MKGFAHQPASKFLFSWAIILLFLLSLGLQSGAEDSQEAQEKEIETAPMDRGLYPVISESDLYCSFYILEGEEPAIKIIGADRGDEKILFTDADIVAINKGQKDGLEIDQVFLILEIDPDIKAFGHLAHKRGRARIVHLEESKAFAKVEKSCGQVMIGHYFVPFEEREGLLGKDLGFSVPPKEGEGVKGNIVYLEREYTQIGSGQWALIDLGEGDGIYVGQQLIIYKKAEKGKPVKIVGNCIVIDTQEKTSTMKVLSCNDSIRIDFGVQTRLQ